MDKIERLLMYSIFGDLEKVKFLIEKEGVDINCRNRYGYRPLHHAAWRGNYELVEYLVSNGSEMDAKLGSNDTTTALTFAVMRNHFEIAKFLIEKGAETNTVSDKRNLLDRAISTDNTDLVSLVLNNGYDVNFYNPEGLPPISMAVFNLKYNTARFLINRGADHREFCMKKRYSPLHYCIKSKYCKESSERYIRLLLQHVLKKEGQKGLIEYVNYNDTLDGYTALHKACYHTDYTAAKVLIEHGADPKIRNVDGQLPINLIDRYDTNYRCELLRLLLDED